MRVLIVHNRYGRPSGEEAVVERYDAMLRRRGHAVERFERSSATLGDGLVGRVRAFASGLGNPFARAALGRAVDAFRPDVVNVHNVFPLISPMALGACLRRRVPVLMTVHNYRLVCPNGLLYSRGEVCSRCVGRSSWPCVRRNCERSRAKSVAYAARASLARWRRDFERGVSAFAALTEFQRARLVEGGIEAGRVVVVPNGAERVEVDGPRRDGGFLAFVGRVTEEKGAGDLLAVARRLPHVAFRLYGHTDRAAEILDDVPSNVSVWGAVERPTLGDALRTCRAVVLPSRCYEGFPMTVVEAMHHGAAVVAPRHGGIPEVVEDGVTGWLFRPHDPDDLARVLAEAWSSPEECARRGAEARARARARYDEEAWAERLEAALAFAVERAVG